RGLARLGILTIRDLLVAYPFRYNDFSQVIPIIQAQLGERACVLGTIIETKLVRPRPRLTIVETTINDGSATLIVSWFNQPWLARSLTAGTRLVLQGKVEHSFGFRRMSSPLFTTLSEEEGSESSGGIMPVYHANSDISQGWMARMVDEALAFVPALLDPLPAAVRIKRGLMSRHAALRLIHHPTDTERLARARTRLAFEEVFFLQLSLLRLRRERARRYPAYQHVTDGPALRTLAAALPFTLTDDQTGAIAELLEDMRSPEPMRRILLGDVGTGKTVVAAMALAAAADSGTQAAMMAPTEVLALQYAEKVGPLLDAAAIPWALLSSSTPAPVRRQTLEALAQGRLSVLFGTHALIEPDVVFSRLSLVIIDEQHRFGVAQRQALYEKGPGSDLLSMTATPIPRSLALTVYGDMDASRLSVRPHANVRTSTTVINKGERRLAYEAVREALARGEQAYIICPLISAPSEAYDGKGDEKATDGRRPARDDGGEEVQDLRPELLTEFSDEQDTEHIHAAEQELRFLRAKVFPSYRIGLMTSRLKSAEKQKVMDAFRAGDIDILVSTTVVEVGIDVPNATVMIIEDADRFGLSQLHQLRGRVGRGRHDGQVFLVSGAHAEEARKRLAIMERSTDGLELAEYDLALRREGDILGIRQHGIARLRLVNAVRDAKLIAQAHQEARAILAEDPFLKAPEHRLLAAELEALFALEEAGADAAEAAGAAAPPAAPASEAPAAPAPAAPAPPPLPTPEAP
ncbi:MAG: ATP-dependent DNA helicase RecG, partial [Coriobacteriales bacterium]|nr:ATP-dependent DNA helicase RecG [Coriobacteriales bacterium]